MPNRPNNMLDSVDVLLYTNTYAYVARLADWQDGSFQSVLSDIGSWTLDTVYANPGVQSALAATDGRILIRLNGSEVFRGILENDNDDVADENGPTRRITFGGRSILALTERGQVLGPAGAISGGRTFTNATPGTILTTVLQEAQIRGCFPELTWTFTGANDSTGLAWANSLTVTFTVGTSVLQVIQTLVSAGYIDVKTSGSAILAANAEAGYAVDNPTAILRPGREATGDPRTRDKSQLTNAVLALGDNGTAVQVTDATSLGQYGRREGTVSQSGVTDTGTLTRIGNATLALKSQPTQGYTYAWDLSAVGCLNPYQAVAQPGSVYGASFNLGDFIRHDQIRNPDTTLQKLRCRSIAYGFDDSTRTLSVELNDLMLEAEVALQKQLDALTGGASATIIGNPNITPPVDTVPPGAVATVSLTSSAYQLGDGTTWAGVTANWSAVATNADGTACTDLDHYLVAWMIGSTANGAAFTAEQSVTSTTAYFGQVKPGTPVQCRVRAVDRSGNAGAYTYSATINAATDATAPNTPSTLVLTPMIQGIRVVWNGLDSTGLAMPPDFVKLEVHRSTVSGFAPSSATLVDTLVSAGVSPNVDLAYGTTYYFRSVAVDAVGNRSPASPQVGAAPVQAQDGDIGSLNVTKLTAGVLVADMTVSSRIKTADTGARSEMDAVGFHVYDASNNVTFLAATTGIQTVGAIHSAGRVEAGEFLTAALSDIQAAITAGRGMDHVEIDSTQGAAFYREGCYNLVQNPSFTPPFYWSGGRYAPPAYPSGAPYPWGYAVNSSPGGKFSIGRPAFPTIQTQTGYPFPWLMRFYRNANDTGTNQIESAGFGAAGGALYILTYWRRSNQNAPIMQPFIRWYNNATSYNNHTAGDSQSYGGQTPTTDNDGVWRQYTWSVTAPAGAIAGIVVFRDTGTPANVASQQDLTGIQLEQNGHATSFCDATWTPGSTMYPGDTDPLNTYSTRPYGIVSQIGGPNLGDIILGNLTGAFRSSNQPNRIEIPAQTPGSTVNGGQLLWYCNGSGNPAAIGMDMYNTRYYQGGTLYTMYGSTVPQANGDFGNWGISSDHASIGCYLNAGQTYYGFEVDISSATTAALNGYANSSGMTLHGGNMYAPAFTSTSARALKDDIEDHGSVLDRVLAAQPRRFNRNDIDTHPRYSGFVAEELHEVLPEIVAYDGDGNPTGYSVDGLLAVTVKALQELAARVPA